MNFLKWSIAQVHYMIFFFYRDDWRVGKSMSVWWPYFIIGVGKKDIIWGKPCIMHSGKNYY